MGHVLLETRDRQTLLERSRESEPTHETVEDAPRLVRAWPWMVGATLLVGIANITWAERIPVHGGFGWDGIWYGRMAEGHFSQISSYYIARSVPSVAVRLGMLLFHVSPTNAHVASAFEVYNLAVLVGATAVWALIAATLRLQTWGAWFGYCSLFLGYAVLKQNFYDPVLTDTTGFALGLLLLYLFLARQQLMLCLATVIGAFTWFTVLYLGLALFLFPREQALRVPVPPDRDRRLATRLSMGATGLVVLFLLGLLARHRFHISQLSPGTDAALFPASVVILAAYVFFGLRYLLPAPWLGSPGQFLRRVSAARVGIAAALYVGTSLAARLLARGGPQGPERGWKFALSFVEHAVMEPGIFLVAHVVYLGPCILLLVVLWQPFCAWVRSHGPGLWLAAIGTFLLSINSESRFLLAFVPILVAGLTVIMDRYSWGYARLVFWGALCIAFSKVWLTVDAAASRGNPDLRATELRDPLQRYFMNYGPWMSHHNFILQAAAVLITGVILYLVFNDAMPWVLPRQRPSADQRATA